jgi:hypothetical protein
MRQRYFFIISALFGMILLYACKETMPVHGPLRITVSNTRPLFVFNIYGTNPDAVYWLAENLPEDIREYWSIQFVGLKEDSPENRANMERNLDAAQAAGMPAFIQVEDCFSHNDVPSEYFTFLFEKYSRLVGLSVAEFSAANTSLIGMDNDHIKAVKHYIDTVVPYGGIFMWQDMGYEGLHPFMIAGSMPGLYQKIVANKDYIILMDKHNGRSKRFVTQAAALGFYASGLIGNWGVNCEDWIWWEAGFNRLFNPIAGITRSAPDWKAVFTYPDALFGIEWLIAAAGGATVFSLECPYHGFAVPEQGKFTPAWHNVILPLARQLIKYILIPGREEVKEKIKVAYHAECINPPEINGDILFRGLYGPECASLWEWLPSTGRYYFLPILPKLAGKDVLESYPNLITSSSYARNFMFRLSAKQAYFNGIYPETGTGDAWFMNYRSNWFIANPNENRDIDSTFKFRLAGDPGSTLSGNLSAHTFAIVREEPGAVAVHLSNYRIDSEKDVWISPIADFSPETYLPQYLNSPSDDALRRSVILLSAPSPGLRSISGTNGYTFTTGMADGTFTITIMHNGPVDLRLDTVYPAD